GRAFAEQKLSDLVRHHMVGGRPGKIASGKLDERRPVDVVGEIATELRRYEQHLLATEHEGGCLNEGKHVTDVVAEHEAPLRGCGSRCGRGAGDASGDLQELRVGARIGQREKLWRSPPRG